ncbi:type I-E CRISPR-associated protein Cse1/CasA [Corynebacterium spheniscorum]|uniref:CRISPR system Cascade subunit CasA n=1 Tax=Corynebacterium spheniscorum TaxID=185761 RepID=A0A1I2QI50_9CORY|nr:type I-E CRISPR-associated protein Cse1/CasA [Corynebacterium spheniscorum]KAA8719629.1 type I-E CRISPR-associated protein Cse1/CasA [Corynebacterium spheniscorum]SFG25271.1 CRISPR system Cascade subunit CasA [Corynebacterium spheniscorum]
MGDTFNLVDEPWIKVLKQDNSVEEVSLRDFFKHTDDYVDLAGELPTQDAAVLRVLLTILYRVFDVEPEDSEENIEAWMEAWSSKALPVAEIDSYLDEWHHRFDLRDAKQPFFLTPTLTNAKEAWKALDALVPDVRGISAMYTRRDAALPISAAEAARWVIHCQAYDPSGIKTGATGDPRVKGGKGYPDGIGWSGWMATTAIYGTTLTETLLLNLVMDSLPEEMGTPAWEQEVTTAKARSADAIGPVGPLSLMTWQSRRIRLKWEGNQVVAVRISYGDRVDHTAQYGVELMTPWRYSDPQSRKAKRDIYMPRGLSPDRAAWRGLDVLLPSSNAPMTKGRGGEVKAGIPAASVGWVSRLTQRRFIPDDLLLGLRLVGIAYGTQDSSVDRTLRDILTFRSALIDLDTDLIGIAKTAVVRADDAIKALGNFAGNLAVAAGGDRGPAAAKARQRAYSAVDPLFRDWLKTLRSPKGEDPSLHDAQGNRIAEAALQEWTKTVACTIDALQRELLDTAPPDAWRGREENNRHIDVGLSDLWYRIARNKALPQSGSKENKIERETK